MRVVFFFLMVLLIFELQAQLPEHYSAASIPDSLTKNANVVTRYSLIQYEVKDVDKAVHNIHKIKTILNKDGASELVFNVATYKFQSLSDVEINVFNTNGLLIKKYKKKDLFKQATMGSFVEDGFYNYLSIPATNYPITVEYIYQLNYAGTLRFPTYYMADMHESVQYSSFIAKIPANMGGLRSKAQRTDIKPEITMQGNLQVYQWKVENLQAEIAEAGTASTRFITPAILLAPNKFKHFNTYGDMSSWKGFGEWGYNLLNGLDDLPEWKRDYFRQITEKASTETDKAAILYKYLQDNFRYVSIQLGIGGVKPFSAKFTDEKKYGDCKGLSFYMYAALKSIGIKSHVAFINAYYNHESADPDFPIDIFDHVILCVPQAKDTVWLECTSKTNEFGVLGNFTENKKALLLTENGGVLVSTPLSSSPSNILKIKNEIKLWEDGSGILQVSIDGKGDYKNLLTTLSESKREDQKSIIVNTLGFKQPDDFAVKTNAADQSINVELAIENVPQFKAGTKMFLSPRSHSVGIGKLPDSKDRKYRFYFKFPYEIYDTTSYVLPEGYTIDVFPEPVNIKDEYASYNVNYWYDADLNKVYSSLEFILNYHIIPADKYESVREFFNKALSLETKKIVIKKN